MSQAPRDLLMAPSEWALEVKHSRFLAHAAPVASGKDALAWLHAASSPDATHNCWAYRVGDDYRSSDDGEPGGSAGRPILAAIDSQAVDRVAVVVTRWYGGIQLGVGGLVRAYGGAAAECLRRAARTPLVVETTLHLACRFSDVGAVHAALASHAAQKHAETFDHEGAYLSLSLPADQLDGLKTRLRDATRNRIRFQDTPRMDPQPHE